MPSIERTYDRARIRADNAVRSVGAELRTSRVSAGRSQEEIARAARISQSQLARIELGQGRMVSLRTLTVVAAAVGLDLVTTTYPGRRILRDQPQTILLKRLRDRLGDEWTWRYEVPVAASDQRAWDAQVRHRHTGAVFVVEAETRIHDVQALLRRVALKRAADPGRVVLLVAGTRNNRRAIDVAGELLRAEYPCRMRPCLAALKAGANLGADAMVILGPGGDTT